jgi:hypothetical protein
LLDLGGILETVGRVFLRFIVNDCSGATFADPFEKLADDFGSMADTDPDSPVSP